MAGSVEERRSLVLDPSDRVERRGIMRALDQAQCLIWFDADGFVVDANANAVSLFRCPHDRFVRQSFHQLSCGPRKPTAGDFRNWARIIAGATHNEERRFYASDGEEIWASASYAVVRNPDDSIRRVLAIVINLASWAWRPNDVARARA